MMEVTNNTPLEIVVLTFTSIGLAINLISVIYKVVREFFIPKLWKYSVFMLDIGHVFLGFGLILFICYQKTGIDFICSSTGFFILYGIFDSIFGFLTAGLILIFIYNPGKSSELTKFHRNVFLVIIVPQKAISIFLSSLPNIPLDYFSFTNCTVTCLKIHQLGDTGTAYGIIVFFILWISIIISTIFCIISAVKLWKGFSNRIQLSSPNIWQSQLVSQGKTLQKFLILEEFAWIVVLFVTILVIYVNTEHLQEGTWIVYTSLSVITIVHSIVSSIGNIMWSSCCCSSPQTVEEPHRKLKKLELVKVEGPGKLRLRALWNISKTITRRGMMKVYGPKHVKEWAQEIVVLGMLRRVQHPSLLQCLWTSSSNPYYETMTLITGEIITSDSRIICFELTNGGTLYEFLNRLDSPLPESCQRMIIHDIAEGLYYLHDLNVLHNNLNSSCIYLKGSLPSMILRAAIGDFEETQIYGSLQQSIETNVIDKRHFFFPDIRSFALVSLEIITKMCEKKYVSMEYEDWESRGLVSTPDTQISDRYRDYMMDSDLEEEYMYRRRPLKGIRSPAEVIEEVQRRSRSHSPGSRPMSAQSVKSRSRTMSPDLSRGHKKSPNLNDSRNATPDDEQISNKKDKSYKSRNKGRSKSPKFWRRNRSKSPKSTRSRESRDNSPSQESRNGKLTPDLLDSKKRPLSPLNRQNSDPQVLDAFAPQKNKVKKSDSKKWLSKPASLIKTLTGAETSVSVFKSKHNAKHDWNDSAEEISDEELERKPDKFKMNKNSRTSSLNSTQFENDHSLHRTTSSKSDQWSIRSDMVYHPHGLKNTVSATSQSSLWSNLPLPLETIDIERDELDNVIESLPGMADSSGSQHPPTLEELLLAREHNAKFSSSSYWQHDGPGPSQFELIDYYDELQGKYVRKMVPKGLHRTLSGNQIIVTPVRRTYSGTQVLHKTHSGLQEIMEATESGDDMEMQRDFDDISPKVIQNVPIKKLKVKLLKAPEKPKHQKESEEQKTKQKEKKEQKSKNKHQIPRSKSFQEVLLPDPIPEDGLVDPNASAVKRSRARTALKRALSNKSNKTAVPLKRVERKSNENLEIKYANVKKLQLQSKSSNESCDSNETPYVESHYEQTKEETENSDHLAPDEKYKKSAGVKRYSSFGSNDSSSSISSCVRVRKADVSLTSGELTSLSSQADADTDYDQMTDIEMPKHEALLRKKMNIRAKMVDSGFDSESSEISSEVQVHRGLCTSMSSEDSAFVEKDNSIKVQQQNYPNKNSLVVTSYPNMMDTSGMFFSEKAFVLTGISSERFALKEPNPYEQQEEKENEISQEMEIEDLRPMSAMSRIIEVSSAAPEARFRDVSLDSDEMEEEERELKFPEVKNVQIEHEKCELETMHELRPKTPCGPLAPLSVTKKNISSPNVYASSTVASRRYRELTKKGVPLRVSVIGTEEKEAEKDNATQEVEISEKEGQKLYDDLESKGFFQSANAKPKINLAGPYQTGHRSRKDIHRQHHEKRIKAGKVSLDEIIRESPNQNNPSLRQKSPTHNQHLEISPRHDRSCSNDDAMLNQPASSEDSETNSIHTSVNNTPQHVSAPQHVSVSHNLNKHLLPPPLSINQQSVVVDAELYIDRIYSNHTSPEHKKPSIPLLDPDFDSPLGVDNKAFSPSMDLELYTGLHPLDRMEGNGDETVELNVDIPLLSGVNDQHINKCRKICNHLVTFHDLLPANQESFTILKSKLYQKGQLGHIGGQLIEIIHKCWLNELPPSSSELVLQLTDPVTETEL